MAAKWDSWRDIGKARSNEGEYFGIYEIGIADQMGRPVPISRIGGVDKEGVVYVGRSGYKPPRTLAQRIHEFQTGRSSGAQTYMLMSDSLKYLKHPHSEHLLRYRAMHVRAEDVNIDDRVIAAEVKEFRFSKEIESEEVDALAHYFVKYGELPPCNSNFPKWEAFNKRVQELGMSEGL